MSRIRKVSYEEPITHRPQFIVVDTHPQRRTPRTLLLRIVVIGVVLLLGGFALFRSVVSVASKDDIPIYPGAQDVKEESPHSCVKVITFRTDDPNDKIIAFYKDVLAKQGWRSPRDSYGDLSFDRDNETFQETFHIEFKAYSKKQVRLSVGPLCAISIEIPSLQTPTPKPPVVNITRKEYEEALAKWQASGIEEYEITVGTFAFLGGTSTVRVSNHGKTLLLGGPSPTPLSRPDPEYIDYVRADTIEGMFEEIERYLEGGQVIHSGAMMSTGGFYMAYTVEFDPDLGYPVHLSGYPVTEPGIAVFDANWSKTVTELKIIKRSVSTPVKP